MGKWCQETKISRKARTIVGRRIVERTVSFEHTPFTEAVFKRVGRCCILETVARYSIDFICQANLRQLYAQDTIDSFRFHHCTTEGSFGKSRAKRPEPAAKDTP